MIAIEVSPDLGFFHLDAEFWGSANARKLSDLSWSDQLNWLNKNLTMSQKRLAACAFARTALYIWENQFPEDKRLRTALEISEKFSVGLVTEKDLSQAYDILENNYFEDLNVAAARAMDAVNCATCVSLSAAAVSWAYDYAREAVCEDCYDSASLEQNSLIVLFPNCAVEISEASKGLANTWMHEYFEHGGDAKGIREILADSLADDGVPEERCQRIRHVENWYLGMWPMTAENFSK